MLRFACPVCDGAPWEPIIVSSPDGQETEPLGSKEKFWLELESGRLLFKFVRDRPPSGPRGEDWAECIVHAVASALDLPSACVALGSCDGHRGVLVKSIVGPAETLKHGNEVLEDHIRGYDADLHRGNPLYTVSNVREALESYSAGSRLPDWSAFDLFTGYLVLDALVSGTDRHHENWGIIVKIGTAPTLAPTFDHGNALGFSEWGVSLEERITDSDRVRAWVEKGRNQYVVGKPRLVELAKEAFFQASRPAQRDLARRLESLDLEYITRTVDQIPVEVMSDMHRMFAKAILETNRRRLLDAFSTPRG